MFKLLSYDFDRFKKVLIEIKTNINTDIVLKRV